MAQGPPMIWSSWRENYWRIFCDYLLFYDILMKKEFEPSEKLYEKLLIQ